MDKIRLQDLLITNTLEKRLIEIKFERSRERILEIESILKTIPEQRLMHNKKLEKLYNKVVQKVHNVSNNIGPAQRLISPSPQLA